MLGGLLSFTLIHRAGLPLVPALIIAILIAAAIGAAMYLLAIRPSKRASVVSLIIITIGAAIFIRGIAGQELTKDFVTLPHFSGEKVKAAASKSAVKNVPTYVRSTTKSTRRKPRKLY
jgi:branched-chain amino acid transport system permease protein